MNYSDNDTGWNNEDVALPDEFWADLPKPMYWRVLIAPVRPKEISKGGIVLASQSIEAQEILNFIGKVIAVGPMAGKHERLGGTGSEVSSEFPKIGDYVAYGRYAGQRLRHRGVNILVVNDDEILAVVPNPETLQVTK